MEAPEKENAAPGKVTALPIRQSDSNMPFDGGLDDCTINVIRHVPGARHVNDVLASAVFEITRKHALGARHAAEVIEGVQHVRHAVEADGALRTSGLSPWSARSVQA